MHCVQSTRATEKKCADFLRHWSLYLSDEYLAFFDKFISEVFFPLKLIMVFYNLPHSISRGKCRLCHTGYQFMTVHFLSDFSEMLKTNCKRDFSPQWSLKHILFNVSQDIICARQYYDLTLPPAKYMCYQLPQRTWWIGNSSKKIQKAVV